MKATASYRTRLSRARAGAKPTPPKTKGTASPSGRRPRARSITGKQFTWRRAPAWVLTSPAQTAAPKWSESQPTKTDTVGRTWKAP